MGRRGSGTGCRRTVLLSVVTQDVAALSNYARAAMKVAITLAISLLGNFQTSTKFGLESINNGCFPTFS